MQDRDNLKRVHPHLPWVGTLTISINRRREQSGRMFCSWQKIYKGCKKWYSQEGFM